MFKASEGCKCFLQNVMRGSIAEGGDKSNAAGFMLEAQIDQGSRRALWALG
jgi:hypothetical protein